MKKLFKLVVLIVIICEIAFFVPKLVHKCDNCGKWFAGTGYEANVIADIVSDDDQTICKSCAEKHHMVEITMGKPLSEFKKGLFD